MPIYDLLIIGAGPAGLAASIYASRYKLSNIVIGKVLGGTMTYAHRVENYPGFREISGVELGQKMGEQVKALGAEIMADEVVKIQKSPPKAGSPPEEKNQSERPKFKITTASGKEYEAKTIIVATGTKRRKLSIPGEEEYLGRGVSYCSNCDAPLYKDKVVVVVGGSDSACSGSLHVAEFASKTYLVYRGEALRAEPAWVEQVKKNPKVEVIYKANVTKILGYKDIKILSDKEREALNIPISQYPDLSNDRVGAVELDHPHKGQKYFPVDGVFIEIGGVPVNSLLMPFGIEVTETGYIHVGPRMETNVPGIYAAGDLADRCGEFQQITVAVSEGSLAAASVFKYLKSQIAPANYGDK